MLQIGDHAHSPNYSLIGDDRFNVSKLYGLLAADTTGDAASLCPGCRSNGCTATGCVRARHSTVSLSAVVRGTGGAIRASLGLASDFADLHRFMQSAAEFVDPTGVPADLTSRIAC